MIFAMNRRTVLSGLLTAGVIGGSRGAQAEGASPVPIGDMHAHLFFVGPKPADQQPLALNMAGGGASLVSWSLVGDQPWIRRTERGLRQSGNPKGGAATKWFEKELARVKAHIAEQNLKVALTPSDLDRALVGEPHVLLSVEGASFLDDGIAGLQRAYAAGVRHIQLVHYIENTVGDFQTEAPRHSGLTAFGRDVVLECNRLGILVDLAHCTAEAVTQTLEVSRAPVVWSHSSVVRGEEPNWKMTPWRARRLSLDTARAIAGKGGVVGVWALLSDVGATAQSYADRVLELASWLGDDHVGFGTDMNALSNSPIANYSDLRRAVEHMERRGIERDRVKKIAIGNYVRVLRSAMTGARP
jgi:membrane dipeptidase